jgi:hypothetical protein
MKSHLLKTIVVLSVFSLSVVGQVPTGKRVVIKIEKFSPTSYGFEVAVSVKNTGTQPLILAETGWKKGTLQSLDIQQWDDKLGWQSVGPCWDVAPMSTVKLNPGESLQNVIPIGDRAHGWAGSVCPRKIEHLRGKVRAILYFAYESQEKFKERDPKGRVDLVSMSVELPLTN